MQPAPGLLYLTASARQKSPKCARSPGTQLGIEPQMPSQREPKPSGTGSLRCWASSVYGLGTICSRRDIKAHVSLQQTHKIQEIASAHAARTGREGKAELPSEAPRDAGLQGGTVLVGMCALCPPAPYPQSWDVLAAHGLPTPLTFSKPRLKKTEEPPGPGRSLGLAVLPILCHSDRRETSLCSYSVSELGRNQQEQRPAHYGRNKADPLGPRQEQDTARNGNAARGRTAPPDPLNLPEKIHRLPSCPREAGTLPTSSSPGTLPRKSRGR